jgi:hypothetical protein
LLFLIALLDRSHERVVERLRFAGGSSRVRSFNSGHTDRDFAVTSASLTTHRQHSTNHEKLVPLFLNGA